MPKTYATSTSGGSGDVTGPASSTDNAIVRFDGTTGKVIQDYTSGAPTISDTGVLVMANNIAIKGRNAANNADVDMLSLNTSNEVVLDGGTFKITDDGSSFYFESKTGSDGEKASLGKGHYTGAHLYSSDGYVTLGAQSGGVVVHSLYSGSDAVVRMRAGSTSQPILRIHAAGASHAADMQQWSDDTNATNVYSRINKAGYFITKKNSAPADADIGTSELAIWFDNTSGAAKIKFKAKDSGGTVRTGEVALT